MNTRKKISIWLYDKDFKLIDFIEQKVNASEFSKDILTKFMNGDLIPKSDLDLKRKKNAS